MAFARTSFMNAAAGPARRRSPLGADVVTPWSSVFDDIGSQYSSMAEDSSATKKAKQAAALLTKAEGYLNDEDTAQCLKSADEALSIFRAENATGGVADALRVMVDAHRMNALFTNTKPEEALFLAKEELEMFKTVGDKRGQGVMLLSLAQVYIGQTKLVGSKDFDRAKESATSALKIFDAIGDKNMQGTAQLELTNVYHLQRRSKAMLEAAENALSVFKDLGNKTMQAKSLHAVALSHAVCNDFASALKKGSEAMKIYKQVGDGKREAFEHASIARWCLLSGQPLKALRAGEAALKLERNRKSGSKKAEAIALWLVVDAHLGRQQKKLAVKAAEDGLDAFVESGDQRGIAYGYEILARAHLGMSCLGDDSYESGVHSIKDGMTHVQRISDRKMEIDMLHCLCDAHLAAKELAEAVQAMEDVVSIAQELKDLDEEGLALEVICYAHLQRRQERDAARALEQANRAVMLFRETGSKEGEASALLGAACAHHYQASAEEALKAAKGAQLLFEECGFVTGRERAMRSVSQAHAALGDFKLASQVARKGVQIAAERSRAAEAEAMDQVVLLHIDAQDPEAGALVALEALDIWQEVEDAHGETGCLLLLAQAYIVALNIAQSDASKDDIVSQARKKDPKTVQSDIKEARENAHEAAQLAAAAAHRARDRRQRGQAQLYRAMASSSHEGAVDAVEKALLFLRETKDWSGEARALTLRAYLHDNVGETDRALEVANLGLDVAQGCEDEQAEKEAEEAIKQIEASQAKKAAAAAPVPQVMTQAIADIGAPQVMMQAPASAVVVPAKAGLDPKQTVAKVKSLVADAIAMDEEVEIDSPLMESGMDSLASVSFMNEVAKDFKMQISPTLVFDFPTIRAMTDHLIEESQK